MQREHRPSAPAPDPDAVARLSALSKQERDVFSGIANGMKNTAIAASLGVGLREVELCRIKLMGALDIKTVGELVQLANAAGIKIYRKRNGHWTRT
jgi:FixJ family two-component response regulator